jgi:hypothetical protein
MSEIQVANVWFNSGKSSGIVGTTADVVAVRTDSTDRLLVNTSVLAVNGLSVAIGNSTINTVANSTSLYASGSDLMIGTGGSEIDFQIGGTAGSNRIAAANSTALYLSNNMSILLGHNDLLPTPPANTIGIASYSHAGKYFPGWIGPTGLELIPQPHTARNRIRYLSPNGLGATTAPSLFPGTLTPTTTGTLTARSFATTNIVTRATRLALVSAATAGSLSGIRQTSGFFTTGVGSGNLGGFHQVVRFAVSDATTVSGARMFVGVSSSTIGPTNVDPATLTNSIGLAQLSGNATQWYLVYGGSAAQSAIALGTSIGAPTTTGLLWEFSLFSSPNQNGVVGYQLTNVGTDVTVRGTLTPGTPGTQTPANSTTLTFQMWRTNNATAAAVALDFISWYHETDN